MNQRGYNFSAGPAMLPTSILQDVRAELLNWQGHGASVLEMGHRSSAVQDLMAETSALMKSILAIPDDYHVLFLGGAARSQFSTIPMNFLRQGQSAAYLITGIWSKMAFEECRKIARAEAALDSEHTGFTRIPYAEQALLDPRAGYLYYTSNETVNGVQFSKIPEHGAIPLVCDMTSALLSEPVDIARYALIFAGAQKNIANAGLTIVIVADRFLAQIAEEQRLPTMLDYRTHVSSQSLYATPPVFNCYLANKMLHWVQNQGGLVAMQANNQRKAVKLYDFIDNSSLYYCTVDSACRSVMNVCFHLKNVEWETAFLQQARAHGLLALAGHRSVGGLRASLYNAMPEDGVDALIAFMQRFEREKR
ncbi:MAG: 3-phosphoserine/phosphohydroxythreonine transaminase [Legionellaceae bacterium]|nr:3-phosphoserine/phosphohydroxythreonine transaminase [Legionellaceae bacterium]